MKSRIKVSTEKLLDAVRAKRAALVAEYERDASRYERDLGASRTHLAAALRDAAERVEQGTLTPEQRGYRNESEVTVPYRRKLPSKPSLDTYRIDQTISTLEMAAEPTVTISADDFASYLR